jgi:hypothetical protein
MKLSRREVLSTALLATAAAPVAPAQKPAQEPAQDWLAVSVDQNKRNAETLEKVVLPQATEPAFIFKP